ncbi:50S ribosomal protein L6 [Candidatus Sumerlaeota bacterium]|nr:50S ribosomal protein L6 [Candidatus Sumerlaeota bacterium]
MSRIGNNPIPVPKGVQVTITPEMRVSVKGPKGLLEVDTRRRVSVLMKEDKIHVARPDDSRSSRAYHGLYQRLLVNMVHGVSEGFSKELEIQGVGYRATAEGKGLTLLLGFSHPIHFPAPEGIVLSAPEPTRIVVAGYDKELVGQVAADIRALRKPEPYKGKGIRYKGEHVRRKVGKAGA